MKKRARGTRGLSSFEDIILDYQRMFADPDNPSTLVVQGTIFGRRGRFEEAIQHFDRAIEIDPGYLDAWFNKGITLISKGDHPGALECFQKAALLDPDHGDAWLKMGSICRRMKNYEKALECLDKCLEREPENISAMMEKMEIFIDDMHDKEKALQVIDRALEIEPDHSYFLVRKGEILSTQGRHDLALSCFEEALQYNPDAVVAWHGKGAILFKRGLYEDALLCFEKALLGSEYYEASLAKGFTLIALERYHQALKDFKFSTRTFSESFELSLGKGLAQMGLRRYPEALKFLDRAIRFRPNEACIWHEKGRLLGKMGREEEARAAYAEGMRLRQAGEKSLSFWPYEFAESLNNDGQTAKLLEDPT